MQYIPIPCPCCIRAGKGTILEKSRVAAVFAKDMACFKIARQIYEIIFIIFN